MFKKSQNACVGFSWSQKDWKITNLILLEHFSAICLENLQKYLTKQQVPPFW